MPADPACCSAFVYIYFQLSPSKVFYEKQRYLKKLLQCIQFGHKIKTLKAFQILKNEYKREDGGGAVVTSPHSPWYVRAAEENQSKTKPFTEKILLPRRLLLQVPQEITAVVLAGEKVSHQSDSQVELHSLPHHVGGP